jgi:hypothetical protein
MQEFEYNYPGVLLLVQIGEHAIPFVNIGIICLYLVQVGRRSHRQMSGLHVSLSPITVAYPCSTQRGRRQTLWRNRFSRS